MIDVKLLLEYWWLNEFIVLLEQLINYVWFIIMMNHRVKELQSFYLNIYYNVCLNFVFYNSLLYLSKTKRRTYCFCFFFIFREKLKNEPVLQYYSFYACFQYFHCRTFFFSVFLDTVEEKRNIMLFCLVVTW